MILEDNGTLQILDMALLPNTPVDHAKAFVETVKEWKKESVMSDE